MDGLLPHYEYELRLLVHAFAEFARRQPKIAARLGLHGEHVNDPHVGHMSEVFALMAARLDARIADDYPEFVETLIGLVYPHYLRGIPSCAIAQFDPSALAGQLTQPFTVPRGTMLDATAAPCPFRTIYDVVLAPLHVRAARYAPATLAPSASRLPPDATGIISITLSTTSASGLLDAAVPDTVRIHLSGERPVVAALTDTLLLRATSAFVEVDQDGRWHALSKVPVEQAGFGDDERLLPDEPTDSSASLRCLREYFAFPELFDFVDLDLGRIRRAARAAQAQTLTLHVVARDTSPDSLAARMLVALDADAFRPFCTPVINLFERPALPVHLTAQDTAWAVTPEPVEDAPALDLYAVRAVYLGERTDSDKTEKPARVQTGGQTSRTAIQPWRGVGHDGHDGRAQGGARESPVWWQTFRDPDAVLTDARNPWRIALVGADGLPVPPVRPQLDVDLSVTSGELPSRLPVGTPGGDLTNELMALSCPIMLLTHPTLPARLPRGEGTLWRVLSMLSPHPFDLARSGLNGFRAFLRLHAPQGAMVAQRCIDALAGLDYQPATRWMTLDSPFPSFVRGVEILVSIDEAALREVTLSVFARVLDRLFAPYAMMNSYVQLVIRSASGAELLRCDPRPGTRALV